MIFKAILSNRASPGYGQVTIPFPIPDSEYDHTIELLEDMGIGSSTAQDCRVDELDSEYPILNRLIAQNVNVDELDYLAKRLDSFCADEYEKFQAMASKLNLSDIKDLINLTFCCQQATVITDFSDLERIGKAHALTVTGGSMEPELYDRMDGRSVALDLIQRGVGTITPYGVVYGNGMKLEQVYDGRHLPAHLHQMPQLMIELKSRPDGETTGCLYLPCPDKQIQRTLERAGCGQESPQMEVTMDDLPSQVSAVVSPARDGLDDLNALCRAIEPLGTEQREKLEAVVLLARPQYASEMRQLAEIWGPREAEFWLRGERRSSEMSEPCRKRQGERYGACDDADQFDFVPKSDSPGADSALTELGYVAYHGSMTLEELMQDDPAEQYPQEMGGLA